MDELDKVSRDAEMLLEAITNVYAAGFADPGVEIDREDVNG